MRVLVVEDDPEVAETVSMAFSIRWPQSTVEINERGGDAIDTISKGGVDLVVLDVNLPDQDGFSVLEAVRKISRVPIIMLTVVASPRDKVRGLETGADDYVAKPFSPFELVARASAVLRRTGSEGPIAENAWLQAGPTKLNPETAEVFVRDQSVKLSPTEFKILHLLLENAGKVVTTDRLLKEIWGHETGTGDAYLIKLHMQHLRRKMGDDGNSPKLILTVRGFGYKVPV